jgi:hypothetical protein
MPPKNTLRRRRHTPREPETGAVAEAMEVNVFDLHDRNRFEVGLCFAGETLKLCKTPAEGSAEVLKLCKVPAEGSGRVVKLFNALFWPPRRGLLKIPKNNAPRRRATNYIKTNLDPRAGAC